MDLEMVLNELSLQSPAEDIPTARTLMSELIQMLIQATSSGVQRVLRTANDINAIELAPDYSIVQWRNDKDREVSRDEQRFFRSLITKAPFYMDATEEVERDFYLSEVVYQGQKALGLAFAIASDSLAVSLRSQTQWDCSRLPVIVTQIDEDEEFIETALEVIHASRKKHVCEHADWIKERTRILVNNGVDLWNRKGELFPNLEFCECVGDRIQTLKSSDPMLQQVIKRLRELQDYCQTWKEGSFDSTGRLSKTTNESQTRLQKLEAKLTFDCPDGKKRICGWHMRMTPGAWRLHFSPEVGPSKLVICYIGPKIE